MEGFVMGLSSSTPTKPPSSDENEHYYQQLGSPNSCNPKKSTKKHYMSPTISAASKAISSRKNILVERNEASESVFSNAHIEKAHVDSLSQATPLTPPVSQSHDYDQNVLLNDLSSMPYDPVTNYLSPRPQFLRYKPNRRRELILGLGNSIAEGNDGLSLRRSGSFESQNAIDEEDGSVTTSSSLGSSDKQEDENVEEIDEKSGGSDGEIKGSELMGIDEEIQRSDEEIEGIDESDEEDEEVEEEKKGCNLKGGSDGEIKGSELMGIDEEIERSDEEIEGIDESDEEDEEVEEEKKGCNLKGVLKSLLVLVVLVLFTSHMASMNQETLFEGGQNNTFEADILKKIESGSNSWDHGEEGHMGIGEGIKGALEIGIEEGKVVEDVEHESGSEVMVQEEQIQMDFMEEHLTVIDEGVKEEMKVEDESLEALAHADEPRQVLASQAEEFETVLIEGEEKRVVNGLGEMVVLQVENIEETSDQMAENSELKDAETLENDESFQHYQTTSMSDEVDHHNPVSDASSAFEEEDEVAVETMDEMVEKKMEGLEYSSNLTAEPVMSETMDDANTGLGGEILDSGAEQNWREELLNHMKSKTFYTAVIGVSMVSVIVASLALVFQFMQTKAINKDSSVIANTGSMKTLMIEQKKMIRKESVISEKYNSALADREEDGSIEQDVYTSFRRMSLSSNSKHSPEARSEEYHSKAPITELLGEFVVGEVSSSLRSCGLKNKMREGDESNYAVSSERKLRSKVHSVSIQQQPSVSEFSYMGSFSHGSYTSEKKIKPAESEFSSMDTSHGSYTAEKIVKMKEGGKNGEVNIIATPVRRSSRIRSKTVMSP